MSRTYPGRFNTASIGAVYAAREPGTAIEELRRRANRDGVSVASMHPRSMFVLTLSLHSVLDLTERDALAAWGLSENDLKDEDFTRCQEVATIAGQHGVEAIRWRSATGKGQSFALFVERLLPGSSVAIEHELILSREILAALQAGSNVSSLVPQLASLQLLDE